MMNLGMVLFSVGVKDAQMNGLVDGIKDAQLNGHIPVRTLRAKVVPLQVELIKLFTTNVRMMITNLGLFEDRNIGDLAMMDVIYTIQASLGAKRCILAELIREYYNSSK